MLSWSVSSMGRCVLVVVVFLLQQPCFHAETGVDNGHVPTILSPESNMAAEYGNKSENEPVLLSHTVNGITFTMQSQFILVFMYLPTEVRLNYSMNCPNDNDDFGVIFSLSVDYVASVSSVQPVFIREVTSKCRQFGEVSGEINVTLTGILLGRAFLQIDVYPGLTPEKYNATLVANPGSKREAKSFSYSENPTFVEYNGHNLSSWVLNGSDHSPAKFLVVCMKKPTTLDSVLQSTMMFYLLLVMLAMGCKTEFKVLKEVWKRPIAPAIGLFCQFVMMPMIAYVLTLAIPFPTPGMALGFFACGCAPGGGGSNLWSYLLGGDVSLSAAMTTISNIAAVGTFPMWIFTLGRVVLGEQSDLKIPYLNMILSLLMVAVPLTVGAILNYKKPVLTKKILRFLIPFVVILTIVFIFLAMYVNFYMFRLVKPILFLSGALLPYIGYAAGLLLSLLFRQSWKYSKTIAIETGIQNTGIAFILVMFSFPPPDNVIAATPAIASSSVTGLPLMVLAAIYHIYLRCCKKKPEEATEADGKEKSKNIKEKENGAAKEKEAMLEDRVSSV